jgi:alpha-D-ribose 1-methylphosphonate 5-triphosphate synthase subunit PhnH
MLDSIWDASVQQRLFRELVEAFSRPGSVRDLTPYTGECDAMLATLASLLDGATTLADPHNRIAADAWRLLQCRPVKAEVANYIAATGQRPPEFQPAFGSLESPEKGATLLVEVDALGDGPLVVELSGPGIPQKHHLQITGLHTDWLIRRAQWNTSFPLGIDMLLMDAAQVAAIPRTTRVAVQERAF